MESNRSQIMTSLQSLHGMIAERQSPALQDPSRYIAISQAFDRLMMGYQNGAFDDAAVEAGMAEIRQTLSASSRPAGLMPAISNKRNEVLCRNYQALADRMLETPRGSWDSRHVDIVQGAISMLAQNGDNAARDIASGLQKRMSDSVWLGNLELAETVSKVEEESRELQKSLLSILAEKADSFSADELQVNETERVFAAEDEKMVREALGRAEVSAIKARMNAEYSDLKASRDYVESLAKKVAETRRANLQGEETSRAVESLRKASERLLEQDKERMAGIFKAAVASAATDLSPEHAAELSKVAVDAVSHEDGAARAQIIRKALADAPQTDQVKKAIQEIEKIQYRMDVLNGIAAQPVAQAESQEVREAQLLDARMMFDKKRMQFEQNPSYAADSADLLKAIDFEVPNVQYTANASCRKIQNDIQRVHQIAQSASAGDAGLYAPVAGSEHARSAARALKFADQASPNVAPIPTIQSELAKRSNRLMRDVKQLAFMPSVRGDMGFVTARSEIDNAAQPLFKRVRFSHENKKANEMLPALYNISGIRLNANNGSAPLRKSFGDLNLKAANLELIKIIEDQFDTNKTGRQIDRVSGAAYDASQRVDDAKNPHARVVGIISDWVESRKDTRRMAADTQSRIKTGRLSGGGIEDSLRSEASLLPASVQEKLSPFLGFDLSTIKIYSGPVAAMAAEAMGAHAFTLGKSIFLGQNKLDFSSPEGLGLLAHELLHTSHFGSGDSVDSKEQAAEAMEARVKQAFGSGGNMNLALEKDSDKKTTGMADQRSSALGTIKSNSVGARPSYDVEEVFDAVCLKVVDLMVESFKRECEREGR